jgi:hypothetical protein
MPEQIYNYVTAIDIKCRIRIGIQTDAKNLSEAKKKILDAIKQAINDPLCDPKETEDFEKMIEEKDCLVSYDEIYKRHFRVETIDFLAKNDRNGFSVNFTPEEEKEIEGCI